MNGILSKEETKRMLSEVPPEEAFHFFTAEGTKTDVSAFSLEDFAEKLATIDVAAIDFHYPRGDFQTWARDVLKDNELSDRLCYIKKEDKGEQLRKNVAKIVQKRIIELKTTP